MLGSITRASAKKGYDLLVSFQQMSNDWHADFEDTRKADGIILLGYGDYTDYEEKLVQLIKQETHFVRWGADVKGLSVVSVGCDNFHGGYQVTQHVINKNRKNFAFLGGVTTGSPEFLDRYKGHCQALKDNNLTVDSKLQIDAVSTDESGYLAAKQLLENGVTFDAICAASDLIAIGAMRAVQEAGYNIPKDIAVVGFDDIATASSTFPAMTTAKQDTVLAGELLVDKLLQLVRGEEAQTQLMPTTLVVRKSCGS
jgi:alanine racemase